MLLHTHVEQPSTLFIVVSKCPGEIYHYFNTRTNRLIDFLSRL